MKQPSASIRSILDQMEVGPTLDLASMPNISSRRIPKRNQIRTWRRPVLGMKFKRGGQRFHFVADILVSGGGSSIIGRTENISDSGIFIASDAPVFQTDEEIEMTIVPLNGRYSYKRRGKIVRRAMHQNHVAGYGLIFV